MQISLLCKFEKHPQSDRYHLITDAVASESLKDFLDLCTLAICQPNVWILLFIIYFTFSDPTCWAGIPCFFPYVKHGKEHETWTRHDVHMLKLLIYEKYDRARHGHDISDILASIYHLILDVDTFF